jgi:hypothetical protein
VQPQARGLWSLVIAVVAAAAALIGSWVIPATATPPREDTGVPWIIFAPASGFIGGLVAGYIIGWRHLGGLGVAAALGSFAAAELLVWVAYPAAPDDMSLLPFHFAIPGVPFAVGCLFRAAVCAPSRRDRTRGGDGVLWAIWETVKFFGFWI